MFNSYMVSSKEEETEKVTTGYDLPEMAIHER